MKTSTFSSDWLKAIAHLSCTMQDCIIADVTRWQLTGEIPDKMSAMRRALFYSIILQIDPQASLEQPVRNDATSHNEAEVSPSAQDSKDVSALGRPGLDCIMPVFTPATSSITHAVTRAQRRRLQKALG